MSMHTEPLHLKPELHSQIVALLQSSLVPQISPSESKFCAHIPNNTVATTNVENRINLSIQVNQKAS